MKRIELKGDVLERQYGKKREVWLRHETGGGILGAIVTDALAFTEGGVEGRVHIRKARNVRIIIEQEEP